jgi:hypothetical protein
MSRKKKIALIGGGAILLLVVASALRNDPVAESPSTSASAPAAESQSAPAAESQKLGPKDDAVAWFTDRGFTGEESPLADGTPRWLGDNNAAGGSASGEVIGPEEAVTQVTYVATVSTVNAPEAGADMGDFLDKFAPGSRSWFADTLTSYTSGSELDEQEHFGDRTVHVQTLTASDGVLVVTTVEHD